MMNHCRFSSFVVVFFFGACCVHARNDEAVSSNDDKSQLFRGHAAKESEQKYSSTSRLQRDISNALDEILLDFKKDVSTSTSGEKKKKNSLTTSYNNKDEKQNLVAKIMNNDDETATATSRTTTTTNNNEKNHHLDIIEVLLDKENDNNNNIIHDEHDTTTVTTNESKETEYSMIILPDASNNDPTGPSNLENHHIGDTTTTTKQESHDLRQARLQLYFDSLQVILGYVPPPSDTAELKRIMSPFFKEVQWALSVMHSGFDKDIVNDDVVINHLLANNNIAAFRGKEHDDSHDQKERNNHNNELMDSDMCLEKTREILSLSMRLAYDSNNNNNFHKMPQQQQHYGKDIADELNVHKAREQLRKLGTLQKGEEEYKLIVKEAFKIAETDIGLDGILNYGLQNWDTSHFWATGLLASQLWVSSLQIALLDTYSISNDAFSKPFTTPTNTIDKEFGTLVDAYNTFCSATCPSGRGWTDNGFVSNHGLRCTAERHTNEAASCDETCYQALCISAKGKWMNAGNDLMNPYTCYMSVCPSGWNNLGRKEDGLMCTLQKSDSCDASCATVQCEGVGGSFPLNMDDFASNPYVCYV